MLMDRKINIIKMSGLPHLLYRFNAVSYFCRYGQTYSKIYMVRQMTQNRQHNIKEEQSWRTDTIWLQDLLERYSSQGSMVFAKEPPNRKMEQNTEPRNIPT
jgi:hypothetical protein